MKMTWFQLLSVPATLILLLIGNHWLSTWHFQALRTAGALEYWLRSLLMLLAGIILPAVIIWHTTLWSIRTWPAQGWVMLVSFVVTMIGAIIQNTRNMRKYFPDAPGINDDRIYRELRIPPSSNARHSAKNSLSNDN